MTTFAYGSDLHLEFSDIDYRLLKEADYLILAGDISVVKYIRKNANDADSRSIKKRTGKFFQEVSKKYKKVFYVFGNHEYYKWTMNDAKEVMEEYLKELNVSNFTILENDFVDIDEIRLIGATLWSDMNNHDPLTHIWVKDYMNDFRLILKENGVLFTTYDAVDKFIESSKFIEESINPTKTNIVVTHHAPLYECNGAKGNIYTIGGYCSNLSSMIIKNDSIKYWICGHTHTNHDIELEKTRIISNCRGYPSEQNYREFEFKVIEA